MDIIYFIGFFTVAITVLLWWGFRVLPRERWQILCSVPHKKKTGTQWQGTNYTYYGFFNAGSVVFSGGLFLLLLASVHIPLIGSFIILSALMAICVPASKWVARIVEKKTSTLSVGGASFVGFVIAPWLVSAADVMWDSMGPLPVLPMMASLAIAYAFGEGLGRLSCISFGCCYGKPLSQVPPWLQFFFRHCCFIFEGKTKKITYADGLDSTRVIPVQAITATLYCSVGLVGLVLFFKGHLTAALLSAMVTTQVWRFVSEFLRADFRGKGKISAYQFMGLAMVVYAFVMAALFNSPGMTIPSLTSGLKAMWNPAVLLFLQALWVAIFLFTGKSQVTGVTMSFHVVEEKI